MTTTKTCRSETDWKRQHVSTGQSRAQKQIDRNQQIEQRTWARLAVEPGSGV